MTTMTLTKTVDLNCDMGESFGHYELGNDAEIMNYITSANVACGFHAGDPMVIEKTVRLAAQKGVAVGAHPSYPDLQGFGRRRMDMTPAEIENLVLYQIGALYAFTRAAGLELSHVKGHGMLQNVAQVEGPVAQAIARGIARFSRDLPMVIFATNGDLMAHAAAEAGLPVIREAFADRAYNSDGTLVSRRLSGALLTDPAQAAEQVARLVLRGEIIAASGEIIKLQADTVCIHGDGPTAPAVVKAVRERMTQESIEVRSPRLR